MMARYTKADLKSMSTAAVRNHAEHKLPCIPKERAYVSTYTRRWYKHKAKPLPVVEFIPRLQKAVDALRQKGVTHVTMRRTYIQGYRKENDTEFRTRVAEVERERAWILLCRKEIKRRDAASEREFKKSAADKVVEALRVLSAKDRTKVLKALQDDTKNR